MWWPWRKPTREQLYRWLMAQYGPRANHDLKGNLETLVKMDLLLKRIQTERALLHQDIEKAQSYDIAVDWVKSPTIEIVTHGRNSTVFSYFEKDKLSRGGKTKHHGWAWAKDVKPLRARSC